MFDVYCPSDKEGTVMSFMVEHFNSQFNVSTYNCLGFIFGKGENIELKKEKATDSLCDVFKRCLTKNYIRATQKKSPEDGSVTFVLFSLSPFYDLAFKFHVIRINFDGTIDHKPANRPAESLANLEEFAEKYPEYDLATAFYFVLA